jgi:RNA methyltransferase, TrmH family
LPARIKPADHPAVLTKAELQRLRSLREKKNREALGLFVIEGEKAIGELLVANFPFLEIYATPVWQLPPSAASQGGQGSAHVDVTRISVAEMARASHFPTPSSVLAVGRITRPALRPGALEYGMTLALDGIQDAGNMGTLLRVADWFAFDRIVMSPDCADVFHQKVINASMGSFARVSVHTVELPRVLADLAARSKVTPILGCDLQGDDIHAVAPMENGVVVIGNEGRGISADVATLLTRRVTIPRYGQAESLNAAIAAAIVCDNLRRARE